MLHYYASGDVAYNTSQSYTRAPELLHPTVHNKGLYVGFKCSKSHKEKHNNISPMALKILTAPACQTGHA